MISLASFFRSFYALHPRVPQSMLAPISVFNTIDQRFYILWARSILLDTRGVHNSHLAPTLSRISRNIRRGIILLQIYQRHPYISDESKNLLSEASLSIILDRALSIVPPGRPSDLESARFELAGLAKQSFNLIHNSSLLNNDYS